MKTITTAFAVLLATIFMTACEKKESAAPAEAAPAATAAPAEAAPAGDIRGPGEYRGRSGDGWRQSRAEAERRSAAPIELTAQGSEFFFGSSFIAWLIQSRKLSTRV